jgi:hypothetical protein
MLRLITPQTERLQFDTMYTMAFAPDYERLIKPNEHFWCHSMGLGVMPVKTKVIGGVRMYFPGNAFPYSYPDESIFPAVLPAGTAMERGYTASEREAISLIFQSTLSFKTGYNSHFKDFDTSFFLSPPQHSGTQPGVVAKDLGNFFEFRDQSNELELVLPKGDRSAIAGTEAEETATKRTGVVIEMVGFRITLNPNKQKR